MTMHHQLYINCQLLTSNVNERLNCLSLDLKAGIRT